MTWPSVPHGVAHCLPYHQENLVPHPVWRPMLVTVDDYRGIYANLFGGINVVPQGLLQNADRFNKPQIGGQLLNVVHTLHQRLLRRLDPDFDRTHITRIIFSNDAQQFELTIT